MLEKYLFRDQISVAICITILIIITLFFIVGTLKNISTKRYRDVIFPTYKPSKKESKALFGDSKEKKKVNRYSLNKSFTNFLCSKGLDKKVKSLYTQAGYYDKTLEDLIATAVKFIFVGFAVALIMYFFLRNIWVSMILGLLFIAFPFINLFGDIQDRRNAFRREFPYFLQTLSFVLSNGSNMSVAFYEVVNKQNDGVLKEVMKDVITTQKVNGGDFTKAFSSILTKISMDETKEFVELVQNNMEKGVSVAETFSAQSEIISRFIKNKKTKKIKAVSTKILIPILIIIVGLVLLFL